MYSRDPKKLNLVFYPKGQANLRGQEALQLLLLLNEVFFTLFLFKCIYVWQAIQLVKCINSDKGKLTSTVSIKSLHIFVMFFLTEINYVNSFHTFNAVIATKKFR